MNKEEFVDVIQIKANTYVKRFKNHFSGKAEIIERPASKHEYEQYLKDKKQ